MNLKRIPTKTSFHKRPNLTCINTPEVLLGSYYKYTVLINVTGLFF